MNGADNSKKNAIEAAVANRKIGTARKLIPKWLKENGKSLDNKIVVCNWFRRLGLFRDAYLVVSPKSWNLVKASREPETARQLLWTARIMSILGATDYAVRIVDRLTFSTPYELYILSEIYGHIGEYEKSAHFSKKALALLPDKPGNIRVAYSTLGGMAEALAALGKYDEAIKIMSKIKIYADMPEFEVWHEYKLNALGRVYAKAGKFTEARKSFEGATGVTKIDERSFMAAMYCQWLGYAEGALGNIEKSKGLFKNAYEIFHLSGIRAEEWLECIYLEHLLGQADAPKQLALFSYPNPHLFRIFRNTHRFSDGVSVWSANSRLMIFPERDEWIEDGQYKIGLSLELKLLAWLRASGEAGISIERLKPMLWPNEMSSFLQLDRRISQLLHRLKKTMQIVTKVESNIIRIIDGCEKQVSVEILHKPALPRFYEKNPTFEISDFAKYYDLSYTPAFFRLKRDVESGILTSKKQGKKNLFSVSKINSQQKQI